MIVPEMVVVKSNYQKVYGTIGLNLIQESILRLCHLIIVVMLFLGEKASFKFFGASDLSLSLIEHYSISTSFYGWISSPLFKIMAPIKNVRFTLLT